MADVEAMIALRQHLTDLRREVETVEVAIAAAERRCAPHRWTETDCEPVHHAAYSIPGDPPLKCPSEDRETMEAYLYRLRQGTDLR